MSESKTDFVDEPVETKNFPWLPEGSVALADGEYDAIVLGTGLTECIISGLLSRQGKRVLHLDRNNYYGADTASLSLQNLFEKFNAGEPDPKVYGPARDWNVDLVPKFIMACGKLVKILVHTKVTRYLDFLNIDGSYVYKDKKVQKVPVTPSEALSSSLMGFFEKRKFRNFLLFMDAYRKEEPKTWILKKSCDDLTTREVFQHFGLADDTQEFTGHAMALHLDDDYLNQPATQTIEAIQLYASSLERYGKSPYIYPLYGLGGIPEGFSRLCAIHGGTFMLNKQVDEILYNASGEAWGVRSGNEVARAQYIIGDPTYFEKNKTEVTGKVLRSICIMDHPIPNTDNSNSAQIIIPGSQLKRKNDIFICSVSSAHHVASKGKYIAIVSTTAETNNQSCAELEPAIQLLGPIIKRFDSVTDLREPVRNGKSDNCYISKTYDATSHFETAANDVLDLFKRITGEEFDLNISDDFNANEDD